MKTATWLCLGVLAGFSSMIALGRMAADPPAPGTGADLQPVRMGRANGDSSAAPWQQQVTNLTLPDSQRIIAAQRLVSLVDLPATIQSLLQQINTLTPPPLATGLLGAVGTSRHPLTGQALVERWWYLTPLARQTGVSILLRRADWTMALLDALERGDITRTELSPEQWRKLTVHGDGAIARRAEQLIDGPAPPISNPERAEVINKLRPLLHQKGDRARGQEVLKAYCLNCHTFEGEGSGIGPNLTAIGARQPEDLLIDIIDPNRLVEADYRLWNVTTKEGETFSGRLQAETPTAVEILDLSNVKQVIQRKTITGLEASALSIMPVGFEALPAEDLTGLLDYLTRPDYWIESMKAVHRNFKGAAGTLAQFGDSITFTMAFWAPLAGEPSNMNPPMAQAHQRVKAFLKPDCWRAWKGPAFGNNGSMTMRWAQENVTAWLNKLNPEVAVILFGSNDLNQMDASEYEDRTRAVVEQCLKNGTVPILTSLPPRSGRLEKSRRFAEAVKRVAREQKVPIIDYFGEILRRRPDDWDGSAQKFKALPGDEYQVHTLISRDGVHPSNPGQFSDYSEEALRNNGYHLRNYLTLLAYADVIRHVLSAPE